ncbi:hypothetical protein B5C00_06105 [Staphylococcus delphini]|uniref:MFS transporter n=1 Tax=Staphylococcus delphini TaxID=53344 RepID=UPI000BBBF682|nr:MFS transporter [Staphylococcus delphini]PCF34004.1 hypothetical protein B5C00_06105 [Staphylococcus delphini]
MKKYPIAIWMLAIGAFAIGMTEFVIMGLLPNVANDLNVSVSQAGQLITGYALGVAIGGPIVVMLTFRLNRKALLILLMGIFIIFAAYFGLLYFIQFHPIIMVIGVFLFGFIGFSMSPSLQYKSTLISQEAPTLSSTLNQSAFNIGNALGAFIDGLVVSTLPVASLSLIAPLLTLIGLVFLLWSTAVERKEQASAHSN